MLITRQRRGGMGDMGFSLPGYSTLKKVAGVVAPAITLPVIVGAKVVGAVAPRVLGAAPKALALVAPAITIPGIVGLKALNAVAHKFNGDSAAPAPAPVANIPRFDPDLLKAVQQVHLTPSQPVSATTSTLTPGGYGGGYTLPDGTVVDTTGTAPATLMGKWNALSTPMKVGLVGLLGGGIYLASKHFGGAHAGRAPKSAQSHHP